MIGHPGITRRAQVEGLTPYLDHLSELDIDHLWEACNDHGWFDLRREHLDRRLTLSGRSIMYTDDKLASAELDKMVVEKREHYADHWVDGYLETGVSRGHVMALVRAWLADKKEMRALELAAYAVIHAGERSDVDMLSGDKTEPADHAASISTNAAFAVKRRSLK